MLRSKLKLMVAAPNSEFSTRLFIWVSFVATAVISAALVVALNAGVPNTDMSWSVQATGVLEVDGKPTVDVTARNGDLVISIATRNGHQVHRTPIPQIVSTDGSARPAESNSARTFWRGDRLIIDNGHGKIVSIDPDTGLLRPVPAMFGWGSGFSQFAAVK